MRLISDNQVLSLASTVSKDYHLYLIIDDREHAMNETYLTTEQLAERIHYDPRTIRDRLKDSVLLEGIHYIRPFGGRKLLYLWEAIERDMGQFSGRAAVGIPMANGRAAHG